MSRSIFLSYRRDDSRDVVGRIGDRLTKALGDENVFLDVDSIPLGVDFRRILREEVGQCQVLIAVIGPAWLAAADDAGRRRLEDPDDFVRIEIETALEQDTPVILALVGGARVPLTEQLPSSLEKMANCAAISLDADVNFHWNMDRLLATVRIAPLPHRRKLTSRQQYATCIRRGRDWALAGAALGLTIGLITILVRTMRPASLSETTKLALLLLTYIPTFGMESVGGAILGWRLAEMQGAVSGLFLAFSLGVFLYFFPFLLTYLAFGENVRLVSWLHGPPIPVWSFFCAGSQIAIAGMCIGGLAAATSTTSRWPKTWTRRRREMFLRIILGATLVAILGCALGIGTVIVGYHTPFKEHGGWLVSFPMCQLTILGGISGFLDRSNQRQA